MKKLVSIILAVTMLLSMTAIVNAQHEHKLMDMANMVCHYSECTICFELFNVGDHTFEDGKCTVCGHDEMINPFVDVEKDAWYHDEVVEAVYTGIINGKTPTEFKPDDLLTYAEAAKLAACMSQVYLNGNVTLKAGEPWYQPYVDYCRINNIITRDFDYGAAATRAGYIEIFANALPDSAFKDINNIPDGSILDVKDNAPYAIYVYKMYRAGILTGVDALHNCNPDDNIKRSEVAAIISRMMNEEQRVEFEIVEKINNKYEEKEEDEDDDDNNQTVKFEKTDEEEPEVEEPGTDNQKTESWDDPINIAPENPEVTNKVPTQEVTPEITVVPNVPVELPEQPVLNAELTIHKQPEGAEYDEYGRKHELEVQVFGGKAPYTYEWQYNGFRNQKTIIENGDYVKDANTEALVLSVEKENTLLGQAISCKITDSEGATVTTKAVKVYGPFSMPVGSYSIITVLKEYKLTGRVADGILRKGDKVSVIRNDKVIAIGIAKDLLMFDKAIDEIVKFDNAEIVFAIEDGATPRDGDIVVKYQPLHVVDTSDIIN